MTTAALLSAWHPMVTEGGRDLESAQAWSSGGRAMTRRIMVRDDRRISDGAQLLLRMNEDRDVANALKLSLANASAYRAVPGLGPSGAVAISCFAVAGDVEAQIVVRGTRWSWYGLSRVGDLRELGCHLIATDVFDGDELLPLSDRHVDVIVCPYPSEMADYATLSKTERSALRAALEDRFSAVLRAFDPRRSLSEAR